MRSISFALNLFVPPVLLIACGKVNGDTPIDANLIDADETGMASVITHTHIPGAGPSTAVAGNIDLISLRPNGSVADMGRTDASGTAMIKVYPGGSVTAIYHHTDPDMGNDFATFFGVKPGDALNFGRSYTVSTTSTSLGTMTLSWPANAATNSEFIIETPCGGFGVGSATLSGSFTMFNTCDHEPMQVIGYGLNTSNQIVAYSSTTLNFTPGGSAGLNGWAAATNAMLNVTGLPPEVTSVSGTFANVANVGTQAFSIGFNGSTTGGAFTQTQGWATAGERTFGDLRMFRLGSFSATHVLDSLQTNSTSWTVAAPTLPPWHAGTLANAAAGMIVWFPIGPPTHDGNIVLANWNHTIGSTSYSSSWSFITPPDQTSITLPKLPPPFSDIEPQVQDGMSASVQFVELPSVANYDALRALPEFQLDCLDCAVRLGLIQRVIRTD